MNASVGSAHSLSTPLATGLDARAITVRFGGLVAVRDADLQAAAGEIVGLIGPNGAGKTTLLKAIAGAVPLTGGVVHLDGKDMTRVRPHQRVGRGMARTFQHPSLFDSLSVFENLEVGSGRLHGSASQARSEAERVLRTLGLGDIGNYPTAALPYGLKKLVDLGRALMLRPKVLLLDEPAAGLNTGEKKHLNEVLRSAQAEMGWSAIVVEHDMSFVTTLTHRVVVLNFGQVIAAGMAQEIWKVPAVVEAYIGVD